MSNDLHPTIAGEMITIRPIRMKDTEMESDFLHRLSARTKHFRFLGGVRELPPNELTRLCDVDGKHSMAFVATVRRNGREVEILSRTVRLKMRLAHSHTAPASGSSLG